MTEILEETLARGFPDTPYIDRLLQRLRSAMLAQSHREDQCAAILFESTKREPGIAFRNAVTPREVTRRALRDIDETMKPYYGYVEPSIRDLYLLGLARPYGEMFLEYFLKDSAVYRVNVAACMCTVAAVLIDGTKTRAGTPTSLATSMRVSLSSEVDAETVHRAATFSSSGVTLSVDYEVSV